ncbi:hypothetical protein BJV77DRAFT_599830 [Russula vinacea]|nr:hypothetical protein BJV77DRAFT_220044 [Russula vinacea]KAH9999556.1 hypothetical protein BJV77DRAFT_599830 [Russula vinacea]
MHSSIVFVRAWSRFPKFVRHLRPSQRAHDMCHVAVIYHRNKVSAQSAAVSRSEYRMMGSAPKTYVVKKVRRWMMTRRLKWLESSGVEDLGPTPRFFSLSPDLTPTLPPIQQGYLNLTPNECHNPDRERKCVPGPWHGQKCGASDSRGRQ